MERGRAQEADIGKEEGKKGLFPPKHVLYARGDDEESRWGRRRRRGRKEHPSALTPAEEEKGEEEEEHSGSRRAGVQMERDSPIKAISPITALDEKPFDLDIDVEFASHATDYCSRVVFSPLPLCSKHFLPFFGALDCVTARLQKKKEEKRERGEEKVAARIHWLLAPLRRWGREIGGEERRGAGEAMNKFGVGGKRIKPFILLRDRVCSIHSQFVRKGGGRRDSIRRTGKYRVAFRNQPSEAIERKRTESLSDL